MYNQSINSQQQKTIRFINTVPTLGEFDSLINQLVTSSSQDITKGTINELRDQSKEYVNVQIPD